MATPPHTLPSPFSAVLPSVVTTERPPGISVPVVTAPIRYCLYARKSTESEEQQVLSIDSQIKEMAQIAQRDGLVIVEIRQESHSAKAVGQREVFNGLITDIRSAKFNGILTWAPDRLSRNAGDLGSLVDLMDQKLLVEIRTFNQKFTNSPSEKFMLMILCSQAKLENDNKSENVKRGMRARCAMGLWPCTAPTGYLNSQTKAERCHALVDPHRAPIIKQMFEKVAYEGYSGRRLYAWLKDERRFTTKNGKFLTVSNIYITLRNTFYYGAFEYPKQSGQWYQGTHTPIITKELYDKAQERIAQHVIYTEGKEFAFTKLMTCGLCGSGITADEKFKKQQNGTVHRYVYYSCSRFRDTACKSGYLREEVLIDQLATLMDTIQLDEIGMKERIKAEIARHQQFQSALLGIKGQRITVADIDVRNYAKYILREGVATEKRELLACIRSKVTLANKQIALA